MTAANIHACLLAVLAHPDDEVLIGGVLANLSERGVRVVLACATKGEAGRAHPAVGNVEDLATLRAAELGESCTRLGIDKPVFLGFHDSARKEHLRRDDPRALAMVDMLEVEAAVQNVIHDVRPQVIVTFDPHGGYYHPDHVAIGRATTAAFFSSGILGADAPERLFYSVMTRDLFRAFAQQNRGRDFIEALHPDVFGVDPVMIAVSFDAREYLDKKISAMAAHRSQFGMIPEPPADTSGTAVDIFRPVFRQEDFVLAGTRVANRGWPLGDLFEGLLPSRPTTSDARQA